MSCTSGSPTTNRWTDPVATAIFTPSRTSRPCGVRTSPTSSMTRCISSAHATAPSPSSPSSHAVTASPLK